MYRRRRFGGRAPAAAVRETPQPCPYKKQRCSGCKGFILAGEPAVRLQLASRFAQACTSCSHKPKGSRWYHAACKPADVNKAMGYDPTKVNVPPSSYAAPVNPHAPTPPPKPKSASELKVESILAFEAALAAGIRERAVARTPELDKQLKLLNNIKQRIIRPGTPAEGETSATVAMKRLIDLVFVNN